MESGEERFSEYIYRWRRQRLKENPTTKVNDEQWFGDMARRANAELQRILRWKASMRRGEAT